MICVFTRIILFSRFLSHLNTVDFGHNKIMSVQDKAFRNQNRLVSLKLDSNKIGAVSNETFYGLREMQLLNLRNNELQTLPANTFIHAKKLQTLNLAKNRITKVDPKAFTGLKVSFDWVEKYMPSHSRCIFPP